MVTEMKERNDKLGKNPFLDDDNFDEAIPIQIRKERTTESYKDNMNEDIETIDKNENIKQIFQKTKWITIYEVKDEDYIKNSNIFPDAFIKKCKQCPNVPQTISNDVKNNIKRMAMEQSLYAQVIMFRRKDLKFDAADKKKNPSKIIFQGQSARSRYWFDLDLDWIDINFSTGEPGFYRKLYQNHEKEQEKIHSEYFKFQLEMQKL